jgi:hypothetical protein
MSERVGVVACGALAIHVRRIAKRRGWDLDVIPVPALLHNRPERIAPAVAERVEALSGSYDRIVVAYGDCGTYGELDELGVDRLPVRDCYEAFAGPEALAALAAEEPGTYFLTDFLARTFDRTVWRELGLDRHPDLRDTYFGHYTRVVWLAQLDTPATRAAAERAASRLQLPLEIHPASEDRLEADLGRLFTRRVATSSAGRARHSLV